MAAVMTVTAPTALKTAQAEENQPPALDIGHPTFKNTDTLEDVYDLEKLGVSTGEDDIMMKIYEQDIANGGDSYYMDRVLERKGVANGNAGANGNDDANTFLTRGRALYMNTSNPAVIGFGGSTAYHQNMGNDLYRITFSQDGESLSTKENTDLRVNQPSNWASQYTVDNGLTVDVVKFISDQNVAVTTMTMEHLSGRRRRQISEQQ